MKIGRLKTIQTVFSLPVAERMLELSGITYAPATAGAPILDGVGFQTQKGRPLLIAGASGSGKTSLLEIISGLASATSGSCLLYTSPSPRD